MNNTETTSFFLVLCDPNIWPVIKSFMFDGKKSSNWENWKGDGDTAAHFGYLALMKDRNLEYSERAIEFASCNGHLEVVKWLYEKQQQPFCLDFAIYFGHSKIVEWATKHASLKITERSVCVAVQVGNLDLLEFLLSTQNIPYDPTQTRNNTLAVACRKGRLDIIKCIFHHQGENGATLDYGIEMAIVENVKWAQENAEIIKWAQENGKFHSKWVLNLDVTPKTPTSDGA